MDVVEITSIIGALKNTVSLFKDALGLLPKGKNRNELSSLIEEAEKKAVTIEADVAIKLGYQICRSHWLPVVMLEDRETRFLWRCPECGKETDTKPASVGSPGVVKSRSDFHNRLQRW